MASSSNGWCKKLITKSITHSSFRLCCLLRRHTRLVKHARSGPLGGARCQICGEVNMLNTLFNTRKVGGIWFVRLGRAQFMFCWCNRRHRADNMRTLR